MRERKIKELAVALKALSRIQADYSNYSLVSDLLNKQLKKAKEEFDNEEANEQASVAKATDDTIPF